MDFNLNSEQIELFTTIVNFSKAKLNSNVFEDDDNSSFPIKKWKACGEFGIQGLSIPLEYGGAGLDMLATAIAIQALGYGCKDEGLIFSICAHMLTASIPISTFGTQIQKEKYLAKLASGEFISGNGITEPDSGSDSPSMLSNVIKDGKSYTINGNKIFVTNAPVADLLIIYARHSNGLRMADVSAFIIPKDNPGMKIGQVFKKMGLRTSPISEIILDDCHIGHESLLGRERLGMSVFNFSMIWERVIMAAYHLGAMQQQFDVALEYTGNRKQFGEKIIKFQSISNMLVDMKIRIEAAKLMIYQACWNYDNGKDIMTEASMVKLFTSEARVKNSMDSVQIFGGYGYMKESMVEKQLRDSIASKIYSGTSEIQKKIISERLVKFYE